MAGRIDLDAVVVHAVLVTPLLLSICAIWRAAVQPLRGTAVALTLLGGFIAFVAAITYVIVSIFVVGHDQVAELWQLYVSVLVVVWSIPVGCWLGFGVGKLIARRDEA